MRRHKEFHPSVCQYHNLIQSAPLCLSSSSHYYYYFVVVVIVVVVIVAIFFHHHHCSSGEIRNLFTFVNVLIILFVYIISYLVKVAVIFVAAAMMAGMAKVVP